MAQQRDRRHWQIASTGMALLANCHRDPKRRGPYRASDFDPYVRQARVMKAPITILRDVFVDGRDPNRRDLKETRS